VKRLIRKFGKELEITLVGAGGTAAAALAWLVSNGCQDNQIVMVADQAALFTRVDSVFENRLFSDEIAWAGLSPSSRDAFFKRLNRGVVWSTVMDQVSSATRVAVQDGRAHAIRILPREDIELTVTREGRKAVKVRSDMLVDASGFNAWWFLGLVHGLSAKQRKDREFHGRLEQSMGSDLQLAGADWPYPTLHAPFVSSAHGPGYGSLMVLGALSDRILRAHVRTSATS
jgi:mycobactin lysine-N-oxygenase